MTGDISATVTTRLATTLLGEDIAYSPGLVDAPGLLRVVVEQRVRPHLRDEGVAVRLNIALLVGGPTDDLGGLAVPIPIDLKADLCLRQDGMIQLCRLPAVRAVGADFHRRD